MELVTLTNNITTLCVKATSFPMGIGEAFQKLEKLIGTIEGRTFYGISRPEGKGSIVYKAAVNELYDGEAEKLNCESFVIKSGTYISETLLNWKKDETSIGKAFQQLLQDTRIDPNGACIEVYLNDNDVQCMVRLDTNK